MASYLIKKDEKTNKIVYMEYEIKGYDFTPKSKKDSYIKINQVTIVNPSLIEKTLHMKFKKSFKKVASNALRVIENEESTSDDAMLCLNEIKRLAGILMNKYDKHLKKEITKEYLTKLLILEQELKMKLMISMNNFYKEEPKEEKTRGR